MEFQCLNGSVIPLTNIDGYNEVSEKSLINAEILFVISIKHIFIFYSKLFVYC